RVYPNPTGGVVDLRLDAGAEVMLVSVFNTTGQLVLNRQLRAGQARLDLSDQPVGTYFLRLQNRLGNSAVRTIIKR
ncbi:MAG: T9SS type A sorting domain-containing protein, partial [Bacteroidota bacterium]